MRNRVTGRLGDMTVSQGDMFILYGAWIYVAQGDTVSGGRCMNTLIATTTIVGTVAYAATLLCGRGFAFAFALLAAAAVPVIALS